MRWVRTRLAPVATLILFVADIAAPRAGFFVHTHRGGEYGHVHLDDRRPSRTAADTDIDRLVAEALGEESHHHHHHHPHAGAAGFDLPDGVAGAAHWHTESPFHQAVAVQVPALAGLIFLAPAAVAEPRLPAGASAKHGRARSPPVAQGGDSIA